MQRNFYVVGNSIVILGPSKKPLEAININSSFNEYSKIMDYMEENHNRVQIDLMDYELTVNSFEDFKNKTNL
jgi:hypothetical protein